ncbi:hypothetical protein PHISCL_05176 [Aspergillus sclerotialis]|uniref:Uncharacterized protein n=1 Tax=Aspergillus sclerotialis TaxID=2070753 RepID=A0A3A2ZIW8_9EURO|nr:hypothetical protein PHISCL_05176 [Aspergillus sclerotialis]
MSELGSSLSHSHEHQKAQLKQWYRVFKPELDTAAHDPLDPVKRYHEGVFVETDPASGQGTLFHVTGDIIAASGMRYEERHNYAPAESKHLHRYTQIGWVLQGDYHSGRISAILRALPGPTKQQGINFWEPNPITGRHDIIWTKEDGEPTSLEKNDGLSLSVMNGQIRTQFRHCVMQRFCAT